VNGFDTRLIPRSFSRGEFVTHSCGPFMYHMRSWLIYMNASYLNESQTDTPEGMCDMSAWHIRMHHSYIICVRDSFMWMSHELILQTAFGVWVGDAFIWFIWTSHQLTWMCHSFIYTLTYTRTGGAPFRYVWVRNVWVRDLFVHMNSRFIHPYESVTHSCIWVRESFFRGWRTPHLITGLSGWWAD